MDIKTKAKLQAGIDGIKELYVIYVFTNDGALIPPCISIAYTPYDAEKTAEYWNKAGNIALVSKKFLPEPAKETPKIKTKVPERYTVYCDGSSINNGQKDCSAGACSVAINEAGQMDIHSEYLGNATNNQAEIVAACLGLENIDEPSFVEVFSDSEYVVNTMNGQYKKKKNLEFWERLEKAAAFHTTVKWYWIKGHSGNKNHDACDKAANHIARNKRVDDWHIVSLF
ncbi:MAG TPA: hypothetical protein PLP33_24915 [Leptospiraceae bacterium]|nr:hypothetical protein [Leptospiraceae bacterium]